MAIKERNRFNELNEKILKECKNIQDIEKNIPFSDELVKGLSVEYGFSATTSLSIGGFLGVPVRLVGGLIKYSKRNKLKEINEINKNETNVNCDNMEWNELLVNNSIDEIVKKVSFNRFSIQHYLNHLKLETGSTFEQICRESNHKESYIKPVFNINKKNQRNPSRDCIIGLSFAFKLNLLETNYLLRAAGYNELYLRDRRDVIIAKCLIESMAIKNLNYYLEKYECIRLGNLDKEEGFLEVR